MPKYIQGQSNSPIYYVKPDVYKIEVKKAENQTSKNGNPMIKMECKIILPDNSEGPTIWHYLTFIPKCAENIDNFLASTGKPVVAGEEVEIEPEDVIGENAFAVIGEEDSIKYPDQKVNILERWIHGREKDIWLDRQKGATTPKRDEHIIAKGNAYAKQPANLDMDGDEIPF
jgi:hypothetical protein